MTMATFHLQIVTPDRLVFDGEARQIILRTVGGDAAILAGHIDYSAPLGIGEAKLTDEEGNDIELEYVDALEDNGQTYMAFFPTVDDETDEAAAEDFGLVILKSVMENGEELLTTLDSDQELQRVYDLFMEQLMDEDDENS